MRCLTSVRGLRSLAILPVLALLTGCVTLTSVAPNPAAAGSNITLAGSGFGATQVSGSNVVYDNANLAIVSWSDTQIVATIPASKAPGTYQVKVVNAGQASGTLPHTLVAAGTLLISNLHFTVNPKSILAGTLTFTTNNPATPAATVTTTAGTWTVPVSGRTSSAPGTSHSINVVNMISGVLQTFNVSADDGNGHIATAGPATYTPGTMPTDTPPFQTTLSNAALMQPGYTVMSMGADENAGGGNIYALDAAGHVVWYFQDSNIATHTRQFSNGHFFYVKSKGINDPGIPNGTLVELDNMGNTVNQWTAAQLGLDSMHHDFIEMPNGNIMTIATEMRTYSGYPSQSVCPNGVCNVVGDILVEFTRAGQVVSEIKMLDVLDPHRVPNWESFNNPNYNLMYNTSTRDGTRCTSIQYLPADDSVIVSCKVQSIVFKLHRATQQMEWVIGQNDASSTGDDNWPFLALVGGGLYPSEQHCATQIANGNITMLDNGQLDQPQESRSVEYALDLQGDTESEAWTYIDPSYSPPIFNYGAGCLEVEPGGTYLISNNGIGEPPIPFGLNWSEYAEVRRSDSLKVWDMKIRDPNGTKNYAGFDAVRVASLYP